MTMARYQFTVTDEAGSVVPDANVEVRREQPGAPLAALKSDRAGITGISNPNTADADGYFGFHVAGGAYKIRAWLGPSGAPTFERIWRYVPIGLAAESDGVDGVDAGILFSWDTGTTDADPLAGNIRANNASMASATFLYISKTSRGASNVESFLLALDDSTSTVKGTIVLSRPTDESQSTFDVTAVTDATDYVKVAVSNHSGVTAFAATDAIALQFYRAGDKGNTGAAGIDGASALTVVRVVDLTGADPTTAYEAGDTLDGKVLATNDIVLRAKPIADAANGVYVVPASGAASRHPAFTAYDDHCGRFFGVKDGTSKGKLFGCTSAPGGTLGTTAIPIPEFTSGGAAGHNRIINPSGMIAQAGLASTADGAYTGFDQWLALTQSNPVTPSALTNVEDGTPYMMRITQANASAQRFGVIQWLETANCIDLRGQSVFLTARVRMSASTTLRVAIIEWTGTADTITKDIVNSWTNTTFTAGQFFTSTSTTIVATGSIALTANTLASISLSGMVSGSMNNLAVFFWTDPTQAQNVTLDVGKVDLKRSSVTSVHEARSYQEEMALCLRYYYSIGGASASQRIANGFAFSATVFACFIEMKAESGMLKAPTVSSSAASDFGTIIGGSLPTPTAITSAGSTPVAVGFDVTVSGATAGDGGLLRAANTNARLNFDARL
ncbi:MAG: hypothetical protein NVV83_10320 [Afipia sp.]|nr:hypothetical protein [Afipia sp.]